MPIRRPWPISAALARAFLKAGLARRLKAVATHIDRLDAEIQRRVAADPALKRRYEIARSIPSVAPVAALARVVGLPELGTGSGKALSLLAGRAPLAWDSGRHRRTPQCAVVDKRLRDAGKTPKVALPALTRKLVVLANTLMRENRL